MKNAKYLVTTVCGSALIPFHISFAGIIFSEGFENGLTQWTGKNGGPSSAVVVADPLGSGRGNVLTFAKQDTGGGVFTTNLFVPGRTVVVSFDYLGLSSGGYARRDLGGFLGFTANLEDVPGDNWLAGTGSYPSRERLVDDGKWHHYSIVLDTGATGAFRLALEDFLGSRGRPGDAYFDNIQIETVHPQPASLNLGIYAGIQITGTVGAGYQIQYAPVLSGGAWTTITNIVLPSSPYLYFAPGSMTGHETGFYRAIPVE